MFGLPLQSEKKTWYGPGARFIWYFPSAPVCVCVQLPSTSDATTHADWIGAPDVASVTLPFSFPSATAPEPDDAAPTTAIAASAAASKTTGISFLICSPFLERWSKRPERTTMELAAKVNRGACGVMRE